MRIYESRAAPPGRPRALGLTVRLEMCHHSTSSGDSCYCGYKAVNLTRRPDLVLTGCARLCVTSWLLSAIVYADFAVSIDIVTAALTFSIVIVFSVLVNTLYGLVYGGSRDPRSASLRRNMCVLDLRSLCTNAFLVPCCEAGISLR